MSGHSLVGDSPPLLRWIRVDVELNKDFSYSSGKGFLTIGPQTENGNYTIETIRGLILMGCAVNWNNVLGFELRRSTVRITRLICASFGITRPICLSFEITRLICASFGITRLICASFGITRLICASDGITRLIDVRVWRGVDRRGARRMREGHMDASSFFCFR
ncbi:hypothetical protein E5676_scaffold896G00300 [Cucumis melo var. makuwa]|uniref:Uncharacterized protein n=1 Tax=Cucumis melo var. makuwa TaxID=1194695 RepID=A0A5D3BKY2_CUCMM|nr:hypothetical protein E6C27_scaffold108G00320 [Cucumis melo var. makuwa]TYJ99787.1 hypothetical protein E5676_scaffold896G00300 [Cucumis melo var. makuwa]